MRILRLAAVVIALAAAAVAGPAHATDPGLSIQLSLGWDGAAVAGSWIPYTVTVRNSSSTRDFTGTLVIESRAVADAGGSPGQVAGTSYRQLLTVPHASQRTVTVYGAYLDLNGGGGGYAAELLDRSGAQLARSPVAVLNTSRLSVGLLSDSLQAAGQIKSMSRDTGATSVVRLSPQTLPSDSLQLAGLGVVVIDNFDSSSLSQAQDRALEQYVGLGGSLVLAGGSGWRRTLTQLPAALIPLLPRAGATASLEPVLDLLARHSSLTAPAVAGDLTPGARAVLSGAGGDPILAELAYGAGRVLEVSFDPGEEPVAGHPDEARASWSVILDRAAPAATGSARRLRGAGVAPAAVPGVPVNGEGSGLDGAIAGLLNDSAANALPAAGILGGLLIAYVIIVGPLNYGILRRLRRRELLWASVPLIALVFTAASYGTGLLVHGRDYVVNEVQVIRVAPDGALDVTSYDALFSPRRGDVDLELPEGVLASTFLAATSVTGSAGEGSVSTGANPVVHLPNLAIWSPRDIKTESVSPGAIGVEAHLRLERQRIVGSLANRGRVTVRRPSLLVSDGRIALLAPVLPPGVTLNVSAPMVTIPSLARADREAEVMESAGAFLASPALQIQALTGIVDALPGFRVGGRQPTRAVTAAMLMPVSVESVDVVPAEWSAPRSVAAAGPEGGPVTVIDYDLPPAPAADQLLVSPAGASAKAATAVPGTATTVEIYDWTSSTWSAVDPSHPFLVGPAKRGPGIIRFRVRGSLQQGLQISSR